VIQTVKPSSIKSAKDLVELVSKRLVGLTARRLGFSIGLYGPAGIGKTQTALGLVQASPCRFQIVQASSSIKLLTNIVRGSKKLAGVIQRNVERLQNSEPIEHHTLMNVYAAMFGAQAPFVLLVEDLHEANAEQLEFWYALAKMVKGLAGVGLIYTSRSVFIEPIENIVLEPLNAEQSQDLLEDHFKAKIPTAALDWIFQRCAGNPLFTIEFANYLTNHDSLWNDGRVWKWREPLENSMPNTVEAVIGQWLSDLPLSLEARVAIEAKAYFETRAPAQGLNDRVWEELSNLSAEHIVLAKQQLQMLDVLHQNVFAHPLYREVTFQNTNQNEIERFALRALRLFEKHNSVLILLFLSEAKLDQMVALELLDRLANDSEQLGQLVSAGWLNARAVEFAEGERKGRLAFKAAKALRDVDVLRSLELVEIASYCLADNVDALILLTNLLVTQRKAVELKSILLRFPESVKNQLSWAENLVRWYYVLDDYKTLKNLLDQYPELESTSNLSVLFFLVRFFEMMEEKDKVIRLAQRFDFTDIGNLTALEYIRVLQIESIVFEIQQNYLEKEAVFHKIIQIARKNSIKSSLCESLYFRGIVRREKLSKVNEALEDFTEAVRVSEEIGLLISYYSNRLEIGIIKTLFGEFEIAEKIILEAKSYFKQTSVNQCILCCEYLVDLYNLWNTNHKNLLISKYINEAIELFEIIKTPYYIPNIVQMRAILALQLGKLEQCLEFANQLLAEYQDFKAQALRIQGLALVALNHKEAAIDAFKRAMVVFQEELNIREEQVTGLELDNLTRDVTSAQERLEWFKERNLNAYIQLARRYFPELIETVQIISKPTLESSAVLEVLGQMRIKLEGKTEVVRGQKRQELLALLLIARMEGQLEIKMDDLRETLYPDHNLKDGSNALRQTIHKIRSSYPQNFIVTTNHGYALGNINSDAEMFLKEGNTNLWSDTFLNGLQLDAGDSILENLNIRLHSRATDLLEHDPKEAVRVAGILLVSNPYDLEALRLQCLGLRQLSQHSALKRTYQKAQISFLEIGEHLPETWAQFLEA
jgi:tetratricopeptide (TPR) repeat protein